MNNTTAQKIDHLIVGGGYVGCLLALLLNRAGLRVQIIEKASARNSLSDSRHFGIARESRIILQDLGLWDALQSHATDIVSMHVHTADALDRSWLSLGGSTDNTNQQVVGRMVSAQLLHQVLRSAVHDAGIAVEFDSEVTELQQQESCIEVVTSKSTLIRTPLLIAADGMHSPTRALVGIGLREYDYKQFARQWKIVHERPHDHQAFEILLPEGPYVVLPTSEANTSKLIWCMEAEDVEENQLIQYFPECLGEVRLLESIGGYPLNMQCAQSSFQGRVVLIGDAYQRVHPVAAQGLNIGLRDAQALSQACIQARHLGLDHGAHHALRSFHHARRTDRFIVRCMTDFLGRQAGATQLRTPLKMLSKLLQTTPAKRAIRTIFHGE